VLVVGVAGEPRALGFFGLAYYEENKDRLKLVGIDDEQPENGPGAVLPSKRTIFDGTYQPLSRPVFIYVSREAAQRHEVRRFIEFYLSRVPDLASEVGYIPFPREAYSRIWERFRQQQVGSVFGGQGSRVGVSISELLGEEASP
jgi:phosphate transport system substrate-binding protein